MLRIRICLLNFIVILSLKVIESESKDTYSNERILLQKNRHGLLIFFILYLKLQFILFFSVMLCVKCNCLKKFVLSIVKFFNFVFS